MKGTEKQIAWAESIVKKMKTFVNNYCDMGIERGQSEARMNAFRETSIKNISAMDNAGKIIDCFKDVSKDMGYLNANWGNSMVVNDGRLARVLGDWKFQIARYNNK